MNVSGNTKICGIIGHPIEHTLSPAMHNAAFRELDLDHIYIAFDVESKNLRESISGIRSLGIHGLNVTIPHKEDVIKYLDEIDPEAEKIGSVNTIVNRDSRLVGHNTDGAGAIKALKDNKVELKEKRVLLLGAGGSAKSIAFTLSKFVKKIMILNRTEVRAEKLADNLKLMFDIEIAWDHLSQKTVRQNLIDTDILINATSVGMNPKSESLVKSEWLTSRICIFDVVYNPNGTKLIQNANRIGAKAIDGIDMLVYQGAMAFKIWTGREPPIDVMKEAIKKEIDNRREEK
jgi:shikimate dehydrogenase